jgi:hypothetical protein
LRAVESVNEIARKLSEPTQLSLVPIVEDEIQSPGRDGALRRPDIAARCPYHKKAAGFRANPAAQFREFSFA